MSATPTTGLRATQAQRNLLVRHATLARRRGWRAWAADLSRAAHNPELLTWQATALSIEAVGATWHHRRHR